jgi:hypothetical protein
MVLQSSGTIRFSDLRGEMGSSSATVKYSLLYGGAGYTPSGIGVPTTGAISFTSFYGKGKYTYPTPNYSVVIPLGSYPYTTTANPDTNSKQIWIDQYQYEHYPIVNYPISYYYIWNNTTTASISATLYILQDDNVSIYLNNTLVTNLAYTGAYQTVAMTIPIGANYFRFSVTNTGGAGAFTAVLRNSGNTATYFYTDSTWKASHSCLVHYRNWYTTLTLNHGSGTYTAVSSGAAPDIEYQLVSSSYGSTANTFYQSLRIQDYSTFTLYFEIKISTSSVADAIWFFVGSTSIPSTEASPYNGYLLNFDVYSFNAFSARGIYLLNGGASGATGTSVASNTSTNFLAGTWKSVVVKYTKGTTNTWVITYDGSALFTYSDANNATWLTNSGSYWGIGARDGGAVGDFSVRRVYMYYS